jgi:hypothetical protein
MGLFNHGDSCMDERTTERLGPPDVKLAGLQIWVHGRQFPGHQDYWDGNWLNVTVHCGALGASVWASGPIIHLGQLYDWQLRATKLYEQLAGEAALETLEPNLSVSLKSLGSGHVAMEVLITPDHMNQSHRFRFEIDQSYLPPLLNQCQQVLRTYPMRGAPPS